jgi:hypothetical protein
MKTESDRFGDFATDLNHPEEIDLKSQNLGLIDTAEGALVNPEGVDDVIGTGGLIDFISGMLRQILRHILRS